MKPIQKRPLATGCSIYLLTVWAFLSFGGEWRGEMGLLLAWSTLVALVLCLILRKSKLVPLCLLLPATLGAAVAFLTADLPLIRMGEAASDGEAHEVRVQCAEVGYQSEYAGEYRVRLLSFEDKALSGDAILICEHGMDLAVGDEIEITVRVEPSGSVEHAFLQEYGACVVLRSEEGEYRFVSLAGETVFTRLARSLRVRMESMLDAESAGLLRALLLGNRGGLPSDIPLVFRNLGMSHALAVSGLHLTFVLFGLEWVLQRLTAPRWLRDLLAIFGTAGYAMLVGCGASVLRAGGMLILTRLAVRAQREHDPPTTLLTALSVIVTVSPFATLDVGLQLSAAATAGILAVMPRVNEKLRETKAPIIPRVLAASAVSLSALAATLAIAWHYFGTVSLMALPANLLLSLPLSLCMACGIGYLLVGWIPLIGSAAAWPAQVGCRLLLGGARLLDGGHNYLLAPSETVILVSLIAAGLAALVLVLRFKDRGMGWRRVLPCVLLILLVYSGCGVEMHLRAEETLVTFLSDGSDDGLIVSNGGMTLILDCSDGSFDPCSAEFEAALRIHGASMPDGYLLSHYHQRSLSAVRRILRTVHLRTLLLPYPQSEAEEGLAARMREFAARVGCETVFYASDGASELSVGEARIRVFKEPLTRSTHPTVRVEIEARGRKIGYLGASAHEAQPEIRKTWLPYCDVLFLGSHGPIIKTVLGDCGEVICADEAVAQALAVRDATVLAGWEDSYTVQIPKGEDS